MRVASYFSALYFSLFCCVLVLSINFGCQKKSESTTAKGNTITHPYFHKGVGGPIDRATADRYKQNLLKKLRQQRLLGATTTVYYLPATVLDSLISAPHAVGVCFYYGEDEQRSVHLVPIGVDSAGFVIPTAMITTTAGMVSWQQAKAWRQRFKEHNPSGIWAHFWGALAVERLLAQGTEQVRISLGLDEMNAQKIMFSNAADLAPIYEEDRTADCPPYCPIDRELNY